MGSAIRLAYDDIDAVRGLFGEYVAMLGMDLSFQKYEEELAELPGKYSLPDGRLFLAAVDSVPVGCIALRRFDAGRGEMKRLFVQPQFRGMGLGRLLVEAVVAAARECGCTTLLLDTHRTLESSVALYRKLRFREVEPYYINPHDGILYFALDI